MTIIKGTRPVQLPGEPVPTTAVQVRYQPASQSADAHPYWNAFADGFVKGLTLPIAVLFGIPGCSNELPLVTTNDGAPCETSPDGGSKADGGADATSRRGTDTVSEDGSTDTDDTGPTPTDAELEVQPDVTADVALDMSEDATATQDASSEGDASTDTMTDAELDVGAEISGDVAVDTAEDAFGTADVADAVDLPIDASDDAAPADASVQDAVDDVSAETSSGICQYFCDAGMTDAADALLPQDATPATDTAGPPVGVASKMCTGPAGTELLFAPANSVAVACTSGPVNALISGAKGCVAECGFFDNNVVLSTAPNAPVPFSMMLFAPPEITKQAYTIALTLHAPVFASGKTPALPGFMESSFVFVYKVGSFKKTGYAQWEALDKDAKGSIKGQVRITYKPDDYVYDVPGFLDTTYTDTLGNDITYTYPCNQIQNPIINCTEVK